MGPATDDKDFKSNDRDGRAPLGHHNTGSQGGIRA
jgi:hypothetical protein